jgi:hypothetical protein
MKIHRIINTVIATLALVVAVIALDPCYGDQPPAAEAK